MQFKARPIPGILHWGMPDNHARAVSVLFLALIGCTACTRRGIEATDRGVMRATSPALYKQNIPSEEAQQEAARALTLGADCRGRWRCEAPRHQPKLIPAGLSERPLMLFTFTRSGETELGAVEEKIAAILAYHEERWREVWRGELESELLPKGPGERLERHTTLHAIGPIKSGFRVLELHIESRARSFNLVDPGEAAFEEPEESRERYRWDDETGAHDIEVTVGADAMDDDVVRGWFRGILSQWGSNAAQGASS